MVSKKLQIIRFISQTEFLNLVSHTNKMNETTPHKLNSLRNLWSFCLTAKKGRLFDNLFTVLTKRKEYLFFHN